MRTDHPAETDAKDACDRRHGGGPACVHLEGCCGDQGKEQVGNTHDIQDRPATGGGNPHQQNDPCECVEQGRSTDGNHGDQNSAERDHVLPFRSGESM